MMNSEMISATDAMDKLNIPADLREKYLIRLRWHWFKAASQRARCLFRLGKLKVKQICQGKAFLIWRSQKSSHCCCKRWNEKGALLFTSRL